MAFIESSGDVILISTLTDLGRKRMAEGNFKITKLAFGDDEINYGTYDYNNVSGSSYFDLQILQTPMLEPTTDNGVGLKSKLITITNNNLLYLPVLKLNVVDPTTKTTTNSEAFGSGSFVVIADQNTLNDSNIDTTTQGYIDGFNGSFTNGRGIRVDQGLDTTELSGQYSIDPDLKETQYIIEMDNRLLSMYDVVLGSKTPATPTTIDDDQIAAYYVSQNVGGFVQNCSLGPLTGSNSVGGSPNFETINGPRGTKVKFGLFSSITTRTSSYLFQVIGNPYTINSVNFYYIDTMVRVTGVNTGYRLDIPVRLVRKV